MAVTTDPFTGTDLAGFINEVWPGLVDQEMFAKSVFANFCSDISSYMSAGGDIAHIPDLFTNALTVSTQSTEGAEITTAGPAQTDTTLTVDTHKYTAYIVGDKDLVQISRNFNYSLEYAKKAAGGLSIALEDALAALWSNLSTNSVGATSAALSDLNVRQAVNKLADTNFDVQNEGAFFLRPTAFWTQIAGVAKFYDASIRGVMGTGSATTGGFPEKDFTRGLVGRFYGIPVYVSSRVVSALQTFRNMLLLPECHRYALQTRGGSRVRVRSEDQLRNLGLLTVADIIYGVKTVREGAGVAVNTNNTATTS
ncbi:MAG: hypothetical protein AAB922_03185 [Patescibacteria group bacterium]